MRYATKHNMKIPSSGSSKSSCQALAAAVAAGGASVYLPDIAAVFSEMIEIPHEMHWITCGKRICNIHTHMTMRKQ